MDGEWVEDQMDGDTGGSSVAQSLRADGVTAEICELDSLSEERAEGRVLSVEADVRMDNCSW